ncbi:hypothetical protein [Actinoplanes teichomyceticus]|uniref:Uncharacterized protein n=1 Tax=Actinoplanes teichomyceticus TaxID=1867 RepID=A0A561WP34_ACTTI|nr:hypothetical protein [Actinoplanes teichomyceticus]TWG25629.1 hypothetical protein FHX34_101599 [Actinoplanes teichomyceticus]GIF10703.1 hypothetical protein Ate01nite_07350 [Actinoplanes teichomyceticus]
MSDKSVDPSGNTEAFRAFTRTPESAAPSKAPYVIGGVVAAIALIALIALLVR